MALHNLVRKVKKTSSAKELIEKAMRQEAVESPIFGPDDWFRISSIGGICPREEVLRFTHSVPRKSGIEPNLGLTFEFGHSVHWVMQNRIMADTGKIVGRWRCTWCGESYGSIYGDGLSKRPDQCIRCGAVSGDAARVNNKPVKNSKSNAFLFVEEWVGNYDYKIGGSPDGYFIDGDVDNFTSNDVVILEFKSASESSFSKYEKFPDFMHVIQCQCYMWITGFKRAKIIYVNKGKFGMDGIAEHDVAFDQDTIDKVKSAISEVRSGMAGGAVPGRVACDSPRCPRANACDVSKICFQSA